MDSTFYTIANTNIELPEKAVKRIQYLQRLAADGWRELDGMDENDLIELYRDYIDGTAVNGLSDEHPYNALRAEAASEVRKRARINRYR